MEMHMKIGDIVVRKSYDKDIIFKVIDIKEVRGKTYCILKGLSIRIIADSPRDDLEVVDYGYYAVMCFCNICLFFPQKRHRKVPFLICWNLELV